MSFELTRRAIRQLCSQAAYDDGDAYYRAKRVAFTQIDHDEGVYEATVKGSSFYAVAAMIRSNGSIRAECTCSTFQNTGRYCKHIAAVLLNAHDIRRGKVCLYAPTPPDFIPVLPQIQQEAWIQTGCTHLQMLHMITLLERHDPLTSHKGISS